MSAATGAASVTDCAALETYRLWLGRESRLIEGERPTQCPPSGRRAQMQHPKVTEFAQAGPIRGVTNTSITPGWD
jgi:hypothetical protein